MILENCISLFDDTDSGFPQDWWRNYKTINLDDINAVQNAIFNRLNTLSIRFFEILNESVLSGEYVDFKLIKTVFNEIAKKIDVLANSLEYFPIEEVKLSLITIFHQGVIPIFKSNINEYHYFVLRLEQSIKERSKKIHVNISSKEISVPIKAEAFYRDLHTMSRFFIQNIKVAWFDHFLSFREDFLSELLLMKNELENYQYNYKEILIDKCNFLIHKILIRIEEDKTNTHNYVYVLNSDLKELNSSQLQTKYFKEFQEITSNHYEIGFNHSLNRRVMLSDLNEKIDQGQKMNLTDYHLAVKEYKDDRKNYTQVKNIRRKFQNSYVAGKRGNEFNDFDKYAWQVSLNYIKNNEFSIYITLSDTTYDGVLKMYNKTKEIQESTKVSNYFPCYKLANYLSEKIDELIKSPNFDIDQTKNYINEMEGIINDAFSQLQWCIDKNFLTYQLPYEECKREVNFNDKKLTLFLSSSFVLPLDYQKVRLELKDLSRKKEKYKTILEVDEHLRHEKQAIVELTSNVEKNDKRSIEILGVFSAIVLFASSSVQIFSIHGLQFHDALEYMLAFAFSLILFVLLIWVITRTKNDNKLSGHQIAFMISMLVLTIVAVIKIVF